MTTDSGLPYRKEGGENESGGREGGSSLPFPFPMRGSSPTSISTISEVMKSAVGEVKYSKGSTGFEGRVEELGPVWKEER